jgi:putative FmdB family regulatory protein
MLRLFSGRPKVAVLEKRKKGPHVPLYEYACKSCKTEFEKLVKSMTSAGAVECPKCGSKETARALSVFAVGSQSAAKSEMPPGMCGRCGGPGPCGMN